MAGVLPCTMDPLSSGRAAPITTLHPINHEVLGITTHFFLATVKASEVVAVRNMSLGIAAKINDMPHLAHLGSSIRKKNLSNAMYEMQ